MTITGLVICHGNLAAELIRAASKIVGDAPALHGFTNEGMSPEGLYECIEKEIAIEHDAPALALVDLHGGSCWKVARLLMRDYSHMRLVSGVGIPMLLSFLTKRASTPFDQLPEIVAADGARGIRQE